MAGKQKTEKQSLKLTIKEIKKFTYCKEGVISVKGTKQYPKDIRWDTEVHGFGVRVFPTGTKSYIYQYWTKTPGEKSVNKFLTIGDTRSMTLDQARETAKKRDVQVDEGSDPARDRKRVQALNYLRFIEETYHPHLIAHLRGGINNQKNVRETMATLKRTFPEFHDLALGEITPFIVEKWRQRRMKDGVRPTSINRQLNDVRACFNKAVEWGAIKSSPFDKVKPSKADRNQSVRFLTEAEEQLLRDRLTEREAKYRDSRDSANEWRSNRGYETYADLAKQDFVDNLKPAVLLSLNTGLRRGELLALTWADVDFDRKMLTVRGEGAKSGQTRHIPLNQEAFEVLKAWKNQPGLKSPLIFHGKNGEQLGNLRKSWMAVLDLEPGPIKDFRWHDLRHTFASKLVMVGVDLNTVRELMGHSDYKMTLRYAHLAPKIKEEAVAKLINSKAGELN